MPTAFATARALDDADLRDAPLRWPRPSELACPLKVTPKTAAEAAVRLGLQTIGDLLEHLPGDRRD